jgi:hypothetical protein
MIAAEVGDLKPSIGWMRRLARSVPFRPPSRAIVTLMPEFGAVQSVFVTDQGASAWVLLRL